MSQLLGLLSIGTGALLSQQRAINVTGNNIANVNTPGYSRQRVGFATNIPVPSPAGVVGFGVRTTTVERMYDRFIGIQLNQESASLGHWDAQKGALERVEVVFDETAGYGLNQALSQFWSGWQDLALNPPGGVERRVLAGIGQNLADTIGRKYGELQQIRHDIDASVKDGVESVNRLTASIADLNQKIARIEAGGTETANDYRDSRDMALKQLSELIEVQSHEDSGGQVVVSIGGGSVLVESGNYYRLGVRRDIEADGSATLIRFDGAGWTDITGDVRAGKVGGWLQARDVKVAGYMADLDTLARDLITAVNGLHAEGSGIDSAGSSGIPFFSGSGAADIAVNAAILEDYNLIAAAAAGSPPGDGSNALRIAALQDAPGGGVSFNEAANALVSKVGHDVREAKAFASYQSGMMAYLENYRDSLSGVSLDEEMVNLIKYQAAYNAAAKMISIAQDMLDNLMSITR
ncbi:MAG: flagellar hook-associated protein FlgK [Desulfobacterales bacterium]|jgi:flagellar hook-associated protein 1 FlgK|nr:flagellar hook-associated protein FlgK [Desulfobacterales bacterium]